MDWTSLRAKGMNKMIDLFKKAFGYIFVVHTEIYSRDSRSVQQGSV